MLDGVQGVDFSFILCGIIWSLALGLAAGNYACSLVHRLPRGRLILDKKPYCGTCGTLLQVKDLFPVISAVLLRHRCRYCRTPFPVSHTWTEILVALLFVLTYLQYGFSEQHLLLVLLGTFLITLSAIESNEKTITGKILICILVIGLLFRVLQDHTIYNAFTGGLFGMIVGGLLWRKQIEKVGHIYVLPKQAQLLTVCGICAGGSLLPSLFLLGFGFYVADWIVRKVVQRKTPPLITVSLGMATMLVAMYPACFALQAL